MPCPVKLVPAVLAGLVLAFLATTGAMAQASDLAGLKRQLTALQRDARNLDTAIEQQRVENARIVAALAAPPSTGPVTIAALRQAQFEVDIARTRLLTLDHRIAEQAERIDELNARIVQASAALTAGRPDTLQRLVEEAVLDWRGRIRGLASQTLVRLETYQGLTEAYLSLRREELDIVQRSMTLSDVVGLAAIEDDPLVRRLQALVDHLAQQALALSNEAASIADASPTALARRNLLRLRADEALLRSNMRLTDVGIVETRRLVASLQPVVDEPAIPIHLFADAVEAAADAERLLAQRAATIALNRNALADLSRILAEPGGDGAEPLVQRIAGLSELLSIQEEEIGTLRERTVATMEALARQRALRERSSLLVREAARTDRAARQRMAAELAGLPAALGTVAEGWLVEVRAAVEVAQKRRFAVFGLSAVLLLLVTFYLREHLIQRFIRAEATRATEIPLEVVRRNLFWLFPVALWWLFGLVFALSDETIYAVGTLIVIPAIAASLRDLTQVIVSRRTVASHQRRLGRIITHSTLIAVVLSAAFVFAYVLLGEVELRPSTQSALNRLAYSAFVLSGLPMLLFVFFFAASGQAGSYGRIRRWVAALLSLLPPLSLIATGITGLAGYTRLAAVMMENLAIAIAIAAALALALGVLNDLVEGITGRLRARDPARAYFARANFLQPVARTIQVGLLVAAIAACVWVFDWTTETPVVREAVMLWRTPLFDAAGTDYQVGSVALAVLAFAFVFWLAGWSRRVAYTVVFGRLRDIGIRQSLSVFAQYVVIVVGVLITLSAVGFDVTTLTVFAASLGVGIGFGLQNVVNNFISGLLLLVERPLRLGDIVTVGANTGTVMQIGIRSMRMKTFDEFDLIVPNSALISDTFTNWTRTNTVMRVVIPVGIAYDDDPAVGVSLVYDVLEAHPGVLTAPPPLVTVDEFADSAINLRVCYYVDLRGTHSVFVVRSDVLSAIWRTFGDNGISIPFPQRDLHMVEAKARPAASRVEPRLRTARDDDWVADAVEMAAEGGKDAL